MVVTGSQPSLTVSRSSMNGLHLDKVVMDAETDTQRQIEIFLIQKVVYHYSFLAGSQMNTGND